MTKFFNYVEYRADRSLFQRKVYREHFYKVSCKSDKYNLKNLDNGVSSARKHKSAKMCPKRPRPEQQNFTIRKHFEHSVEITDTWHIWNHSPAPSVNELFMCPGSPLYPLHQLHWWYAGAVQPGQQAWLGLLNQLYIVNVLETLPGIMSMSHA